jgi:TolB protein
MKSSRLLCRLAIVASLLLAPAGARAAQELTITREFDLGVVAKPVRIALSGFTGEVDAVLRFDLYVQGFDFVAPDQAQFLVSGSNAGRVEGRVQDAINKASLLAKAYAGGSLRAQAHALADDIVMATTQRKGIGQTKIAYKADTGKGGEIYVADFDGYNAVAVTQDGALVFAPAWAPGRRLLYYTSYKLGNPDIFSHDLGSGARQAVARYSGLNTGAAVSPDGRRLAMILSKSGSPDVWVSDADGSNLKQLTATKEDESSPCWSPDGRLICFTSRLGGATRLYTVPADGGEMKRLPTVGVGNATEPDWSPDGKWIVFTRLARDFELCVIPAAGGEAKVLVAGEDPSWAPNSRTVIFTRRAGNRRVLSVLDVPTRQVKDVSRSSGSCSQPSWAK